MGHVELSLELLETRRAAEQHRGKGSFAKACAGGAVPSPWYVVSAIAGLSESYACQRTAKRICIDTQGRLLREACRHKMVELAFVNAPESRVLGFEAVLQE